MLAGDLAICTAIAEPGVGSNPRHVMTAPDGASDIQRLLIARNLTGIAAF
ncbi:MAG: hypothetical protein Q7T84_20405 [Phenylobacterium sp.]|nr:hypothetical protein [Phenylobacterium sp.]MDO9433663.1 hypothetical protein [Phenylobacterium sp.]